MSRPDERDAPPAPSADSALELILERDPAGVYALMDAATRERYRRACHTLAAGTTGDASAVAHEAVRLAAEQEADTRGRHVGAWLIAEGQPTLEARLGHVPSRRERLLRPLRPHAQRLYVLALFGLVALALLGVERVLASRGVGLGWRLPLLVLLGSSLFDFLHERLNALLSLLVPPLTPLPRLDPERGLTPQMRTLVVTPLLITREEDIASQLRMMEMNALGNGDEELGFALLTDFRDAPEKELPGEPQLLERLEAGVRELNARHGHSARRPRFFVLHRERRWNPVAGHWMGWERKRGKLEEFNHLVLGADDTSYRGPVPAWVRTVRYALTLDADTHLLPGAAVRLVATLHHPLNQPRLDATGRRVVAGYSLLQPDMEHSPTRALWLERGGWPLSLTRHKKRPQPDQPWVLLQRLFGTGEFLGKGLYDIAAFTRGLDNRLPENIILSHDKLEGMFVRVAFVHDVKLFESHPEGPAVLARIWHRWMRGDWQQLPWLLPRVPTRDGRREPNTLPPVGRLRLFSDLNKTLQAPLSLVLLTVGWAALPAEDLGTWTLGATLWVCRHSFVFATGHLVRGLARARSPGQVLRAVGQVPGILLGTVANLAFMPSLAGLSLDAIVRTLYRLAFDPRRLLDWTTHAQSTRGGGLSVIKRPEVWGALLLTLAMGVTLAVFNPAALPWASPVLLLWIPGVILGARAPPPPRGMSVPAADVERLRALARDVWAHYAGRELPRETSPSELALGLVALVSAWHLECLELEALVSRLDAALTHLEGLPHHRGHLLAAPGRVSTADSGVLAAALIVVESGLCSARSPSAGEPWDSRLEALEARARARREAMDFTFLYDGAAGLLHTGYDVETGEVERAHHTRLISGAVLAGFTAIARGQVPLRHWLTLATADQRERAAGAGTPADAAPTESLLPTLFCWYPPATLLAQAARATLASSPPPPVPCLLSVRFQRDALAGHLRHAAGGLASTSAREQAVTLAAVANLTCDDILVRHFHQHWQHAWVEALVYETKDTP